MRHRWLNLLWIILLLLPLLGGAGAVTVVQHEVNNTLVGGACSPYCAYGVYLKQNLSQSFTATSNYTFSRVSLYVFRSGISDTLNVSLVADGGGIPSSDPRAVLARGSNTTGTTQNWYFFDLSPHVRLTFGSIYWIVARNRQPNIANGYGWWRSGNDSYAGGTLAVDQGAGWFQVPGEDMPFRNYGYNDAQIKVALGANRTQAPIDGVVRYTVYLNNTGPEIAARVWVNLTLPAEVSYISDTAGAMGGTRTGNYNWSFTNVSLGPHSFTVDVRVRSGFGGQGVTATARLDFRGVLGSIGPGSQASKAIVLTGPGISVGAYPTPPFVRRGDNVTFTVYYNNTGNDVARWLWVNNTLPALATYLRDTANASRSFGPGRLNLTFSNVTVGPHSFIIVLTQRANLTAGSAFPLTSTAAYRDRQGHSYPGSTARATVILRAPRVGILLSASRGYLTPGDTVALRLQYNNTGSGTTLAGNVYLNLTLGPNLALRNASAGAAYNATSHTLTWFLPTLLPGAFGALWANATSSALLREGQAVTIASKATFRDDVGSPMAPVTANITLLVRGPVLNLAVGLGPLAVEVLQAMQYRVYFNNTGSGYTNRTWVNITLSPGLTFTGFDLTGSTGLIVNFQPGPGRLGFVFTNLGPGSHLLVVGLTPIGPLANGTVLSASSTVAYRDTNGNPGTPRSSPLLTAVIKAPVIKATLRVSSPTAPRGATVTFTLGVTNQGLATTSDAWVNVTLHPSLVPLTSQVPWLGGGSRIGWHLRSLPPGASVVINFTARVADNATEGNALDAAVFTEYSNSQGEPLGRERGNSVGILVPATAGLPLLTLGLVGALGAALAVIFYILWAARKEPEVEEVLLIHREGLLLAQASRGKTHGKDRDILAGSLVAIQAFIKDAFQAEAEKDLERMDLGEYKILIRRGKYVFLVVAVKGMPTRRTGARLQAALERLESQHADTLAEWMGNMDEMGGVQQTLEELMAGHLGPARPEPAVGGEEPRPP